MTQIVPLSDCSREYILKTAACLEEHFPHSVARAVVRKALEEGLHHEEEHAEVEYIVAHGISSRLHGKKVLVGSYHFLLKMKASPSRKNSGRLSAATPGANPTSSWP